VCFPQVSSKLEDNENVEILIYFYKDPIIIYSAYMTPETFMLPLFWFLPVNKQDQTECTL
jgi:hypothetical protein